MNKIAKFITTAALAVSFSTTAQAKNWDMPTPYSDATFHTVNIAEFAKDVKAATDGALSITIHSAGSLFKHSEIKNAVRSRQVPIGEFFLGSLSNEDAAFGLDTLPFLAASYEEGQRLWVAQKPVVTALLAKQHLMPLFSVPWPAQGLYTNGVIAKAGDLSGLKFRAYNAATEKLATLAGAAPTQVEAPDIPQAFATGQVQAMVTSPSTGANTKAWDFVSHYTPINAWVPKNIVVVNKKLFDRLDENIQAAVLKAASAAEVRGWEMSKKEAETKTAVMVKNGMVVAKPTDELISGLKAIGAQMLKELLASSGAETKAIVTSYQAK